MIDWQSLRASFRCAALVCALAGLAQAEGPRSLGALVPAEAGATAHGIAKRAEDQLRSDRTYFSARMTVVSPRLPKPRVVAFRNWEDSPAKKSFIRILEPSKDEGTGFLKLDSNLWMYVPRVERTVRVPPSMMLQSWMGSDFTNDDLVRESSVLDDYDHRLLGIDESGDARSYVVEYIPKPDAPVVWGRILSWIDVEHYTPRRQEFFDEDGEALRVMQFSDVVETDGRHFPRHWAMVPLDKEGHSTSIEILEFDFDAEIESGVFTKRALKRR